MSLLLAATDLTQDASLLGCSVPAGGSSQQRVSRSVFDGCQAQLMCMKLEAFLEVAITNKPTRVHAAPAWQPTALDVADA